MGRLDDFGMDSTIEHAAGATLGHIGLVGAGGHDREVASYVRIGTEVLSAVSSDCLDAAGHDQVDITAASPAARAARVVCAVGAPTLHRVLVAA